MRPGNGDAPEEGAQPPEAYYSLAEAQRYTSSHQTRAVQRDLTLRALQLSGITHGGLLVLDLGCGSGLSGQVLTECGHHWIGTDVSAGMLQVAAGNTGASTCSSQHDPNRSTSSELFCGDFGQGIAIRDGAVDAVISISAAQWLLHRADAPAALARFFGCLLRCLRPAGTAMLQVYVRQDYEALQLMDAARGAGFLEGGLFVDFPHRTAARKYSLLLLKAPQQQQEQQQQDRRDGQDGPSTEAQRVPLEASVGRMSAVAAAAGTTPPVAQGAEAQCPTSCLACAPPCAHAQSSTSCSASDAPGAEAQCPTSCPPGDSPGARAQCPVSCPATHTPGAAAACPIIRSASDLPGAGLQCPASCRASNPPAVPECPLAWHVGGSCSLWVQRWVQRQGARQTAGCIGSAVKRGHEPAVAMMDDATEAFVVGEHQRHAKRVLRLLQRAVETPRLLQRAAPTPHATEGLVGADRTAELPVIPGGSDADASPALWRYTLVAQPPLPSAASSSSPSSPTQEELAHAGTSQTEVCAPAAQRQQASHDLQVCPQQASHRVPSLQQAPQQPAHHHASSAPRLPAPRSLCACGGGTAVALSLDAAAARLLAGRGRVLPTPTALGHDPACVAGGTGGTGCSQALSNEAAADGQRAVAAGLDQVLQPPRSRAGRCCAPESESDAGQLQRALSSVVCASLGLQHSQLCDGRLAPIGAGVLRAEVQDSARNADKRERFLGARILPGSLTSSITVTPGPTTSMDLQAPVQAPCCATFPPRPVARVQAVGDCCATVAPDASAQAHAPPDSRAPVLPAVSAPSQQNLAGPSTSSASTCSVCGIDCASMMPARHAAYAPNAPSGSPSSNAGWQTLLVTPGAMRLAGRACHCVSGSLPRLPLPDAAATFNSGIQDAAGCVATTPVPPPPPLLPALLQGQQQQMPETLAQGPGSEQETAFLRLVVSVGAMEAPSCPPYCIVQLRSDGCGGWDCNGQLQPQPLSAGDLSTDASQQRAIAGTDKAVFETPGCSSDAARGVCCTASLAAIASAHAGCGGPSRGETGDTDAVGCSFSGQLNLGCFAQAVRHAVAAISGCGFSIIAVQLSLGANSAAAIGSSSSSSSSVSATQPTTTTGHVPDAPASSNDQHAMTEPDAAGSPAAPPSHLCAAVALACFTTARRAAGSRHEEELRRLLSAVCS